MTSLARPFVWGFPPVLIVAAAALGPERVHAPTLPTRAAMAIGDASYALYLVHPFAIRGLGALVRRLDLAPILGGWGSVALALAAAAAAAPACNAGWSGRRWGGCGRCSGASLSLLGICPG